MATGRDVCHSARVALWWGQTRRGAAGALPRVVVIALGSNSSFTRGDVRSALRILGPRRILGLVTPERGPASTVAT
jgi:hypothetical protein